MGADAMTKSQRQAGLQRVLDAPATLYRPVTEQERREAARGLGIEGWLPEPEQKQIELKDGNE